MKLRAKPKLRITESRLQSLIEVMVRSVLQEKAKSKNQQEFMGMVHACKKSGYKDCASKEVEDAARRMKAEDAEDFASTSHEGLPEKVDESVVGYSMAGHELDGGFQDGPMQRFGIDSQPSVEEQFIASVAEFFGGDRDQAKEFLKSTKKVGFDLAVRDHGIEGDAAYELMKMISGRDLNAES